MTKDLIEEALRWANGHPNRRSSELMRELADALEAQTGVRVDMGSAVGVETQLAQGAPNDDRCLGCGSAEEDGHDDCTVTIRTIRAAVPDAGTEETCAERMERKHGALAHLRDVLKSAEAERDAALAAVGRVRAVLAEERAWHEHLVESGDAVPRTVIGIGKVEAALDGAPEPEWVYTVGGIGEDGNVWADDPEYWGESGDPGIAELWVKVARESGSFANAIVVKRRKAGPWLPVEGESNDA